MSEPVESQQTQSADEIGFGAAIRRGWEEAELQRETKLVNRYRMMPDCGACEDDEHADCSHPIAMSPYMCCCEDHPLVEIIDLLRVEGTPESRAELDDALSEADELRAALKALVDATRPITKFTTSAEDIGATSWLLFDEALSAAQRLLGEPE